MAQDDSFSVTGIKLAALSSQLAFDASDPTERHALPEPSGNWISARDAQFIVPSCTVSGSRKALCRRAVLAVPVRAFSFSRSETPHEGVRPWDLENSDLSHFKSNMGRKEFSEMGIFFQELENFEELEDHDFQSGVQQQSWDTGDFVVEWDGNFSRVELKVVGLQFDKIALERSLGLEPDIESPGAVPKASSGGKPAASHGDAIAAVTLRLSTLPTNELKSYTNASLAEELAEEYRRLSETPPSEGNRDKYAGGIMRVLRARQT